MRIRSEWVTLFTLTTLAASALLLPRASAPDPASQRAGMTSLDYLPTGTARMTAAAPTAKATSVRHTHIRPPHDRSPLP
jgi:hypothetical protein